MADFTVELVPAGRRQDRREDLAELFDSGATIALAIDRTPAKRGRPKAHIDIDEAISLYVDQVQPLAKVAATLGVATLTLRKRFEAEGVAVRGRGRPVKGADRVEGGTIELECAEERSALKERIAKAAAKRLAKAAKAEEVAETEVAE